MKKIIIIIFLLGILPTLVASSVKVVYIPDSIKIENNASKEIIALNMSGEAALSDWNLFYFLKKMGITRCKKLNIENYYVIIWIVTTKN